MTKGAVGLWMGSWKEKEKKKDISGKIGKNLNKVQSVVNSNVFLLIS